MSNFVRIVMFSFLIAAVAGGCASMNVKNKTSETIKPSGVHEDCFELTPGQVLDYSFVAPKPLNFNIHYHEDHNIFYPVKKDAASSEKGTFHPEKKQFYCLMWTNNNTEPVTINYEYSIRKETK